MTKTKSTLDIALSYIDRGWNPIPIPHKTKRPLRDNWGDLTVTRDNVETFFSGGPKNIGIQLGPKSGNLVDVDLDSLDAVKMGRHFLPETDAIFGRASKRSSHYLYKITDTIPDSRTSYTTPANKMMLELRTGAKKAIQTVFPGSVHESGELIEWDRDGEPALITFAELVAAGEKVAIATLLLPIWNATTGDRHTRALVLGGVFARAGWSKDDIANFVGTIAHEAGDDEVQDRERSAADAADNHARGEHTFGTPSLKQHFGEEVGIRIASLLGEKPEWAKSQVTFQTADEFIANYTPPNYLIGGIVQRSFLYALTAHPNAGKTAILLSFTALVAQGKPLGDREIAPGRCMYLVGENQDDFRMRWIGMKDQLKLPDGLPITFLPGVFPISKSMPAIRAKANEMGGVDLVVVDTASAYFEGDDENSNTQWGNYARRLRELTTLKGRPAVIVASHPPKNAEKLEPRGGGAFLGEIDGNLTCVNTNMIAELWHTKLRGPSFDPISFRLTTIQSDRLKDSKGREMTTVAAEVISDAEQVHMEKAALQESDALLVAMLKRPGGTMRELADDLGWPSTSKVSRVMNELKGDGLASKTRRGGHWTLTKAGKKEAEGLVGRFDPNVPM